MRERKKKLTNVETAITKLRARFGGRASNLQAGARLFSAPWIATTPPHTLRKRWMEREMWTRKASDEIFWLFSEASVFTFLARGPIGETRPAPPTTITHTQRQIHSHAHTVLSAPFLCEKWSKRLAEV